MSTPEALKAAGDYRSLWEQALPLVKWTLGVWVRAGKLQSQYLTDDLIQECNLAVGRAIPKWDPARGAFSTFMVKCIRTAAMDHIRREESGIVGGRDAQGHAGPIDERTLASDDVGALMKLIERESTARVRAALQQLPLEEVDVLSRTFGFGNLPQQTARQLAGTYNMKTDEVSVLLARAIASMRKMLSDNNSGEHSHESSRSPGL